MKKKGKFMTKKLKRFPNLNLKKIKETFGLSKVPMNL